MNARSYPADAGIAALASALLLAASLIFMSLATPARAEIGSDAQGTNFGPFVRVNAAIRAPSDCARIIGKRNGAPPGMAVARNAKAVTLTVAMSGGRCGRRNVLYSFQTLARNKDFIQLFFVTTNGRLLKKEKVSISPY